MGLSVLEEPCLLFTGYILQVSVISFISFESSGILSYDVRLNSQPIFLHWHCAWISPRGLNKVHLILYIIHYDSLCFLLKHKLIDLQFMLKKWWYEKKEVVGVKY